MRFLRGLVFFCGLLVFPVSAVPAAERGASADDEEASGGTWSEAEWRLPDASLPQNLLPFYVSAATSNKFFVDAASLSVGSDGVVRYLLLVETPEGGRNITFEGMRCETRERRIYASGRLDGSWSRARSKQWFRIQDGAANRHHAALALDYFCPGGVIVRNVDEILAAMKRDAGFVGRRE